MRTGVHHDPFPAVVKVMQVLRSHPDAVRVPVRAVVGLSNSWRRIRTRVSRGR